MVVLNAATPKAMALSNEEDKRLSPGISRGFFMGVAS
jgi:hypothetical protein